MLDAKAIAKLSDKDARAAFQEAAQALYPDSAWIPRLADELALEKATIYNWMRGGRPQTWAILYVQLRVKDERQSSALRMLRQGLTMIQQSE